MKYNISQVSKILGISNELLRHYERKKLIEPLRNETGYSPLINYERLRFITNLSLYYL